MPNKILAATDFSDPGNAAVRHAADLGARTGAPVVLLHVTTPPEPPTADLSTAAASRVSTLLDEIHAEAERRAGEIAAELRERGASVDIRVDVSYADTAIAEIAPEVGADLIVMGTEGRTGIRRFFVGSTAERVARLSPVPVLVTRPPLPEGAAYRRVLVPTDFSDASLAALDRVAPLAAPDAVVELFHAYQPPGPGAGVWGSPSAVHGDLKAEFEARARERLEAIARDRGELKIALEEGGATASILERLESGPPCDLVALGGHGERGFRRRVLGSVAERIVRHAPCSVLVAQAAARGGAD